MTWHEAAQAVMHSQPTSISITMFHCRNVIFAARPFVKPSEELACTGYRLPTNAEWEYASKHGTIEDFSMGGGNN